MENKEKPVKKPRKKKEVITNEVTTNDIITNDVSVETPEVSEERDTQSIVESAIKNTFDKKTQVKNLFKDFDEDTREKIAEDILNNTLDVSTYPDDIKEKLEARLKQLSEKNAPNFDVRQARQVMQELEQTNASLLYSEPFYCYFVSGLAKKVTKVGTACVSKYKTGAMLQVDPDFWSTLNTSQRVGLLKHEVLHLVFKHIFLHEKMTYNHKVMNIACDIVVNQYINEEQMPTKDAVRLENFANKNDRMYIDLEHNQSAEYYYYKLMDLYNKFQPQLQKDLKEAIENALKGDSQGDSQGEGQDGSGEGQDEGQDGSGKSNKPSNNDSNIKGQDGYKSWKELEKFILQEEMSHAFWDTFKDMSETDKQIIDSTINEAILNAYNKNPGKCPGHIQSILQDILDSKKAVVDWRKLLKRHIKNSFSCKLKNTIHRVSKRYGTSPGIKKEPKQTILVAIDTSGSISDSDLADFFVEIHKIYKEGYQIHVVESDCAISKTWDYKGKLPEVIGGRGGTEFDPAIEYANRYNKQSVIVYFTDGYANPPRVASKSKIIWCISRGGISQPLANCPGKFIYLDN